MSITITLHTDKPRLPTKKKLRSWMEYFFAQLNVHEKKNRSRFRHFTQNSRFK